MCYKACENCKHYYASGIVDNPYPDDEGYAQEPYSGYCGRYYDEIVAENIEFRPVDWGVYGDCFCDGWTPIAC